MSTRLLAPQEVTILKAYFMDRLEPGREYTAGSRELSLEKGSRYYARQELLEVNDAHAMLKWRERWCDKNDWTRARSYLRAQRYKARNQLVRSHMSSDFHALVETRASMHDLSVWQYLDRLGLDERKLKDLEIQAGLTNERITKV